MALRAGSIPVTGSKHFAAGYNQLADGEPHKLADTGANPVPVTTSPTFLDARGIPVDANIGRVTFEQTRPDQSSR